jgi:aspartate/methionine/tyrosine aminotransferase
MPPPSSAPPSPLGALRSVPFMGVIYVVAEAEKLGFTNGDPDWCNLGQGQPEVGPMAGAPARISTVSLEPGDHAYGPVGGTRELRERIADHYNRLYRRGLRSQYTSDNVSVASGGRLVLSRAFAALGAGSLGYQVPDYTAYEDMIGYHHHRFSAVPLFAREEQGFKLSSSELRRAVDEHALDAFVLSNPCNPTGQVVAGDELKAFVELARERRLTLLLDEFYSHFVYSGGGPVSAAAHVQDVDLDPVILVDGLTKCFRYPGWRLGWAVGPKAMLDTLSRTASAIDGGPSRIVQRAALAVLEPAYADQETSALRAMFARKRDLMVARLERMGIRCAGPAEGTFYVWATIAGLPAPFNDAEAFFRRALDRKVMTVPGEFFDVNPGKSRTGPSPFRSWVRFSFGPPEDNVRLGLERLEAMLAEGAGIETTPRGRVE